jgi:hypothetical protein
MIRVSRRNDRLDKHVANFSNITRTLIIVIIGSLFIVYRALSDVNPDFSGTGRCGEEAWAIHSDNLPLTYNTSWDVKC